MKSFIEFQKEESELDEEQTHEKTREGLVRAAAKAWKKVIHTADGANVKDAVWNAHIDAKDALKAYDKKKSTTEEVELEEKNNYAVCLTRGKTVGARTHRIYNVAANDMDEAGKLAKVEHKRHLPNDPHKEFYIARVVNHGKTDVNEEVEQIDELSRDTLASYEKKSRVAAHKHAMASGLNALAGRVADSNTHKQMADKRHSGWKVAVKKLNTEESELDEEQLDESGRKVIASYIQKAKADMKKKIAMKKKTAQLNDPNSSKKEIVKESDLDEEQLDELSPAAINRYKDKSRANFNMHARDIENDDWYDTIGKKKDAANGVSIAASRPAADVATSHMKLQKRLSGLKSAYKKLAVKEELDLDEEQLDEATHNVPHREWEDIVKQKHPDVQMIKNMNQHGIHTSTHAIIKGKYGGEKVGQYTIHNGVGTFKGSKPHQKIKEESDTPFDGPYKQSKGTVTDKSGAKHTPLSNVRSLARNAIEKMKRKMRMAHLSPEVRAEKLARNPRNEELVGGQKKLDVDKDGKIEKSDLEVLRAKKLKEDVTNDTQKLKAALDRHTEKAVAANKAGDHDAVKVHQVNANKIKTQLGKLALANEELVGESRDEDDYSTRHSVVVDYSDNKCPNKTCIADHTKRMDEAAPTGIKIYHKGQDDKESHTIVFSAVDAAKHEKELKQQGRKVTGRSVMSGKTEGPRKSVTEEFEEELEEDMDEGVTTHANGITVHKGTYGTSYQPNDDEDDEDDTPEKKEPAVKRGRGRPAGAKSGAKPKGSSAGKSYGGLAIHSLRLPNNNK